VGHIARPVLMCAVTRGSEQWQVPEFAVPEDMTSALSSGCA